jgi:signal peptide peptidase SppA
MQTTIKPSRCAAQVFGAWACEPRALRSYVDLAKSGRIQPKTQDEPPETEYESDNGSPGPNLYSVVNGIAIIQVRGPISKYPHSYMDGLGGTASTRTRQAVRAASRDGAAQAILLILDTPGGTVAGLDDLARDVADAKRQKSVYAYCEDMCCSAGYWIASQCQRIYANHTALIGCLGVLCLVYDTSGAYAKEGTQVFAITSDGSEVFKPEGHDGVPITPEREADLKREANEVNAHFLAAVQNGRGFTAEETKTLFDGRSFVGSNAQQLGLIDEVVSIDAAIQAISTEVQQMNQDDFTKYAAEHPEAVKTVAAGLVTAAKEEGHAQGVKAERERFEAIFALKGASAEFARDQFRAGADSRTAHTALADNILADNQRLQQELAEAKKNPTANRGADRSPPPLALDPNPQQHQTAMDTGLAEGRQYQQAQLAARGMN